MNATTIIITTVILLSLLFLIGISVMNYKLLRKKPSQELHPIDYSYIEQCIRKEGYVPTPKNDHLCLKVSGEEVDVFYGEEKLSLVRSYGLDDEVNLNILSQACSMLHDSTFLIRSSMHEYDNGQKALIFEVQTMVSSSVELDKYFGRYLSVLCHGIERHREYYGKLLEESSAGVNAAETLQCNSQKVLS